MRKFLNALLTLLFVLLFFDSNAQVTIGAVDAGPYGYGSNVTVPISFAGNQSDLPIGTTFQLFLSDAAGNFAGNGTSLGTFSGFYTPAVNGVIPTGLAAGTGYRLRVRISNPANNPVAATLDAGTISILAQSSPAVTLSPNSPSNALGGDNIGFCANESGANKTIVLRDNLPATTIIEVQVKNLISNTTTVYTEQLVSGSNGYNITNLAIGYYSVTAIATTIVNGVPIKSIKTYTLHNTNLGLGISDSSVSVGCINGPGGSASVSYEINSITGNYPGTIYRISWGDGSTVELTYAQISANSNSVFHTYTETSCGRGGSPDGSNNNSFQATITAASSVCGTTKPITVYAQVLLNPTAEINGSAIGCTNVAMTFTNDSRGGTRSDCSNQMDYEWFIDNDPNSVLSVSTKAPLTWTFTTPGPHTVRLVASNGSNACIPSEDIFNVCVQIPPVPAFTLSETTTCLSSSVTANSNSSVLNNTCSTTPVYTWTVNPAAGVTFTQGSPNPEFRFPVTGTYTIGLAIQTGFCSETAAPQTVIVNSPPQITMSPEARLCTKGGTFTFGATGGVTQTTVSGTTAAIADTYTWVVSGPAPVTFINQTGPNSKEPQIMFSEYGAYTVTLTHKNNCGTLTSSQNISFSQSPEPLITVAPNVCYNSPITLQGAITNGTYVSFAWTSNIAGTFTNPSGTFADPSALNTTFTTTDLTKTSAIITLTVNTGIPGNCMVVADAKTITISPNNTGINTIQSICTGSSLSYTPVSSVPGSTFRWTATNADGNAQAGSYLTSGTGNITATSIINTSPTANAEIIYTIIPESINGNISCDGVPYTLTVRVTPLPVLTVTVAQSPICSGNQAGITMTSNLDPSTLYTWVSSISGGTVNGAVPQPTPLATTVINNRLENPGNTTATVTYTITPYSNGCPGTPVTVSVQVDPALTIPEAGIDENICNSTTFTLKGNQIPTGKGIGTWTLTSGQTGVTFADEHLNTTIVQGLVAGQTYEFTWTVTGGSCDALSDEMTLFINVPTVAGTTATTGPVTVCEGVNSGTVNLTGNTGSVLRWENSTDGGASWSAISNTTTVLTYTNITINTQYRAFVQNGQCAPEFSTATAITVTPATSIANAGTDQTLCNELSAQLNAVANLKAGESGLWTVSPSAPNLRITDPTNPSTRVTNIIPGQTYIFTWTISGPAPCGPTRDDVVITNLLPLTNTINSTSTEVCYNQVITITGNTPTGGNGTYVFKWEVSTDEANWNTLAGQTGRDLSYQLQATTFFRRTVTSSACLLLSNTVRIIAQPPIGNNTIATGQTICTGTLPGVLTGTPPTGSDGNFNYQWQSSADGTNWTDIVSAVFPSYAPPILTATTSYRRLVSTITCNGALRSTSNVVTIIVKPNAKAEFTYTVDKACTPFTIDANNVRAVAYPDRNATYSWYANNVLIGTGVTFPGYTISTENTTVTIKLVTSPSTGCQPDEMSHDFSTNQAVAASYTQSTTSGCGPLTVNFVNTSTSLTGATFRWDFGNGITSSQTMPAPVTFQPDPTGQDITYTVTLTATTVCGISTTTSTVFVKALPISVFSPSRTVGCSPMAVTFTNGSPGETNTYYYDFGDGTLLTKNDKLPVTHTFVTDVVRDFTVTMIAQNECGSDQSSYTIRVSPNTVFPELVVNANEQEGCAPLTVNFYNNSRGANTFKYDFGDGSTVITRSAPEVVRHTFTAAGTYTITLTASNGCSEVTTTESVTVLPQPVTAFSADITLGCPGLPVQFRNTSRDGVAYQWDFGDGTNSNEFEPKHIFTGAQEYYTISLTATNSLGCTATTTLNQYIHIVPPPVAQFNVLPSTLISIPNYTFRFEDESTNRPTIWAWDFGDGTTSVLQSPSHTYPDTGKYVVTLRVSNQQGCFTSTFKTVTIVGVPGYLFVPNSFMPGSPTPELREFIAKGSGIKSWRMTVFNKWGQTLWETTQLNEGRPVGGWDGTFNSVMQPQGVYFWKIDVEFINGSAWKGMTYDSSAPKKTGVIHLIR
ncbi:PKD domain-containing protein [Pedobacter hartonius]|uniref:PKD repeat-containing protein n=1 Tax=Pedobacter hartonius TaxID=425514 RepID=A0A1H3ZET7_9SPHI|nr:PKD domain-containing protein [Pedobacter hartonius]SEA22246.1 PKD repeat-containing protein [Pedobacter hartonius]